MKMRCLKSFALGTILGTSTGAYGQAMQREASSTLTNSTAISSSGMSTRDIGSAMVQSPVPFMVQDTVTVKRSVIVNPPPPPKTSLDQTVTITKSMTSANIPTSTARSASSNPSATPNPFKACWATAECKKLLTEFAQTYNETGKITNPNEHDRNGVDQSHIFQRQLCVFRQYANAIPELPPEQRPMNLLTCMACFKQAGLDTNTEHSPTLNLMYKIDGFCHTNWPNEFDLLEVLFNFMSKSEAPTSIPELPAEITGQIPGLKSKFTWTSDMNRKTGTGEASTSTWISTTSTDSPPQSTSNSVLPWLGGPLTPGAPLPTELLAQVPPNWPYTEYGMLYKAVPVTSMPLTAYDPLAEGNSTQTVAWLYHSFVWNPRPLYTPPSARTQTETLYQPLLESWIRSATWARATQDSSPPPSTQKSNQTPGAPSDPTITQLSVLSLEPDIHGESSHARSAQAESSSSSLSGKAAALGVMTRMATTQDEQGEYNDLMNVIASMKSRLDERE